MKWEKKTDRKNSDKRQDINKLWRNLKKCRNNCLRSETTHGAQLPAEDSRNTLGCQNKTYNRDIQGTRITTKKSEERRL